MNRDEILKTLAAHRKEFKALDVKSLALFGSVARGEGGSESDVDVLVEFEGRATFNGYMELKLFLEDLLGHRVDLVTHKALKPRLRPYVEKDAIYVS